MICERHYGIFSISVTVTLPHAQDPNVNKHFEAEILYTVRQRWIPNLNSTADKAGPKIFSMIGLYSVTNNPEERRDLIGTRVNTNLYLAFGCTAVSMMIRCMLLVLRPNRQ